ncbi:hypothetical protein ACTZ9G_003242 [Acinetobacter baumannii]|uniref:hypothetical protein n=1 Tax=Acinetobacter baumannii TaxID=470 RepID=UPI00044F7775|nr:hypothetical protein [Acinetobacter baumannii]EHZ6760445.1 hypothetical protein [Acinetobacter baumannii]EHZ7942096.1 hypothetical protein [Acinetobacter baumannii]EIW4105298.1 hypothetical protein [Acinetobacter baumannii]EKT9210222.1 hypothetical protein [Acinetobacter baumannii]EKT9383001.1 hypothetical protein [Acinetobacter baumannii]
MKIAYIGGVKHGKDRNVLTGYDKTELDWEVKTELPRTPPTFQGSVVTYTISTEYQTYLLKILKKNGELKYFYVLKDLPREEIETGLADCWELSDNLGYDFD